MARASDTARRWLGAGLSSGDRVLIARPTSWEWIDAWLGALLAGGVPVAVPPGANLGAGRSDVERIESLVAALSPRHVLVSEALRLEIRSAGRGKAAETSIAFEELASVQPAPTLPQAEPRQTAFLQLTGGTSGRARAVEISDTAVIHNTLALNEALAEPLGSETEISTIVSWLPLYHDLGLVGSFLMAMLTGRELCLLPPSAFIARPQLWLEQIATRREVFSPSPNFGFQLCKDRLKDATVPNLSSWRAAGCGAEMIHPETVAAFESAFEREGFRPEAFRPGYGLAEATVAVTVDRKGRGVRTRQIGTQEVVCVGEPVRDTEVRITAPSGIARLEGETGEVWVRGPGLFTGYHNNPQETREALKDGWLRTGDQGFLHRGELYCTGRSKELLIIHGQNLLPQELEWLAEGIVGGALRAAAFSVSAGAHGEQAILVVETEETGAESLEKRGLEIRERIGAALGLPLADLIFVRRGRIPKTSSGKIRRAAAKELYLEGRLQPEKNR